MDAMMMMMMMMIMIIKYAILVLLHFYIWKVVKDPQNGTYVSLV
jgi:hypothetical protein